MPGQWISGFGSRPPAPDMTAADLRCSFCGKSSERVKRLIAGPTPAVAICNECVQLCSEMLSEQDAGASA